VFLFFGTVTAVLDWDIGKLIFGKQFLQGSLFYLYKLILDVAGIVCLAALGIAFYKRFMSDQKRQERSLKFFYILGSLALIIVTGFLVEALRLAAEHPAHAAWSPVGNFIATVFYSGFEKSSLINQHLGMWLFHMLISLALSLPFPSATSATSIRARRASTGRKRSPAAPWTRSKTSKSRKNSAFPSSASSRGMTA
jgi:nitrate reductase gamma subunit